MCERTYEIDVVVAMIRLFLCLSCLFVGIGVTVHLNQFTWKKGHGMNKSCWLIYLSLHDWGDNGVRLSVEKNSLWSVRITNYDRFGDYLNEYRDPGKIHGFK